MWSVVCFSEVLWKAHQRKLPGRWHTQQNHNFSMSEEAACSASLWCVFVFVSSHTELWLWYDSDFSGWGFIFVILNLVKFQSDRQVVFLCESLSFFVLPDSISVRWVRLRCSPVTHSLLWQVSVLWWLCLGSRPALCLGPSHWSLCQYLWCSQSAAQVTYHHAVQSLLP